MAFPTLNFTGQVSGGSGVYTTNGTFSATIMAGPDNTLTGTWAYTGDYMAYNTDGTVNLSGTLAGTGGPGSWNLTLSGANLTLQSFSLDYAGGQYSLDIHGGFNEMYTISYDYGGSYSYNVTLPFNGQLAVAGPAPDGSGATGFADTIAGTPDADSISALGGNDTITGGAGNDTIDGGDGTDTVVFSDVRANYTVSQDPGTGNWTVTHNVLAGDGTDTLVHVERLTFADEKIAIDIGVLDHGAEAYRLYQAAFNRVPDIGGLGYQMNALDTGLTLEQVAGNFIASPEFQATYGTSLDNTQFLTLLYQNVLHRAPDEGGLQFHLAEMAAGQTRVDELIHFSQSPENQANVAGAIQDGMLFVFP